MQQRKATGTAALPGWSLVAFRASRADAWAWREQCA